MSFDPNLPANNTPNSSAEMRAQLQGLKALIDAIPAGPPGPPGPPGIQGPPGPVTTAQMNAAILSQSAGSVSDVFPLTPDVANPTYDPGQMQEVISKLNELIFYLKRP